MPQMARPDQSIHVTSILSVRTALALVAVMTAGTSSSSSVETITRPSGSEPAELPTALTAPSFTCPTTLSWCRDSYSTTALNVTSDVPFGTAHDQLSNKNVTLKLDVYSPPLTVSARPAIVVIHGGGFHPSTFSSKTNSVSVGIAQAFARRGFVALSIEYRCERGYGGNTLWTDAVTDARAAVQWVANHDSELHVDSTRIMVMGSSAGAVTVAGLCFMPDPVPVNANSAIASIRAGVSVSGCLFNDTTSIPAGQQVWNHLYTAVGPKSPQYLDIHGTADPVVPYSNASARPETEGRRNESCSATDTQSFLQSRGARSYLAPIPGAGHVPAADLYVTPWNVTLWGFVVNALDLTDASPVTEPIQSSSQAVGTTHGPSFEERTANIKTGDLLFVRPPLDDQIGLDAGILDTGNATIWWLREHGVSVTSNITVTHVAIALRDELGQLQIVQAVPPVVTLTPGEFFFSNITGVEYFHGTITDPTVRAAGSNAVTVAMKQLGRPYANAFQQPSSGEFYCSSLVEYAYQQALARNDPVFTQDTFHLLFVPKTFWRKYYAAMNVTMPVNETGSNPTLLLHSNIVNFTQI